MSLGDYIYGPDAEALTRIVTHGPPNEAEQKVLERLRKFPKAGTMRDQILRLMLANSWQGLTRIEIANFMETTRDHIHPRMMELEKGGWVRRGGQADTGQLFHVTDKALDWRRQQAVAELQRADEA